MDIPTDADKFDEARDGKHGNNVIDKLGKFEKILADEDAGPRTNAAEAAPVRSCILWVTFTSRCTVPSCNKDRGGNTRLVFFLDRPKAVNLHAVWDTSILLHDKGNVRILDYALWLNGQIDTEEAKRWAKGTPREWANESHRVRRRCGIQGSSRGRSATETRCEVRPPCRAGR